MPSTDLSRRRLLAAGGCLSAVVAGCTGIGESEPATHTVSEGGEPIPSDEYESLTLRSNDDELFVSDGSDPPDDDPHPRPPKRVLEFVLSEAAASELRIDADDVDADEARAFLESTDFETESIAIDQRTIDDCYRRHVLSVQANPDEFRTQYCRSLKAPTTPCEDDATVVEAIFFRLDRAYDEAPSSRASSESASCSASQRPSAAHGDTTDTAGDGNTTDADAEGDR